MKKLPDSILEQIIPLPGYIDEEPWPNEKPVEHPQWFYTCKNTRACFLHYEEMSEFTGYSGQWLFEMHGDSKIVENWAKSHSKELEEAGILLNTDESNGGE